MVRTGRPRGFDEEAVVARAVEVFRRRGYAGTSVQDLVDELGLQRGSLYGAFTDKRGLFRRALQAYVDASAAAVEGLRAADPVVPALRDFLSGSLRPAPTGRYDGCLLGNTAVENEAVDDDALRAVTAALATIEDAVREALERAHRSGELPPGDAAGQARLLVALTQGLQVVGQTGLDRARSRDAVDAALAALGHRPPGGV